MTGVEDVSVVVVVGLAVYRVWVLVAHDNVLNRVRAGLPSGLMGFLACPWCFGFWLSLAAVVVVWFWGDETWVRLVIVVLAVSAVVGLAAAVGAKGDE